jgi:hypothetical protein
MEMFLNYMRYKSIKIKRGHCYMTFTEYVIYAEQMRLTNAGY